jgi:hypothetical protein
MKPGDQVIDDDEKRSFQNTQMIQFGQNVPAAALDDLLYTNPEVNNNCPRIDLENIKTASDAIKFAHHSRQGSILSNDGNIENHG